MNLLARLERLEKQLKELDPRFSFVLDIRDLQPLRVGFNNGRTFQSFRKNPKENTDDFLHRDGELTGKNCKQLFDSIETPTIDDKPIDEVWRENQANPRY